MEMHGKFQEIVEAVASLAEAGQPVDPDALLARFPGEEATIDGVLAAAFTVEMGLRGLRARRTREALTAGTTLGPFVIDQPIGEGGEGRVYRALQRTLGNRVVALKVLDRQALAPGEVASQVERFQREAMLAATVHHPHLAEVYEYGEQGAHLYYAMRYVAGPNLQQVLGRLATDEDARRVRQRALVSNVAQVASALAELHRVGLVHRDVKPANIVLEGGDDVGGHGGRAVLVDFGLALVGPRPAVVAAAAVELRGTRGYVAPEVLAGAPASAQADVWALGATLHDLLTGQAATTNAVGMPNRPPLTIPVRGIDHDLAAIVARALDRDPRHRYADGKACADDLTAWLDNRPVLARRPHLVEGLVKLVRRRPRAAAVAGGMLVGTAAAAVYVALLGGRALAAASDARQAVESGRLAELAGAMDDLRESPVAGLFMDGDLAAIAATFDGMPRDPLVGAARLAADGRHDQAIECAWLGLYCRKTGHPDLLRDYLAQEASGPAGTRRTAAVHGLMEFARGSPDADPSDVLWSSPMRSALAAVLRGDDASPGEECDAVSALSGVGTLDDVPEILSWGTDAERSPEESRLAVQASAELVSRAAGRGLEPTAGADLLTVIAEAARRSPGGPPTVHEPFAASDWWLLLESAVLGLRDSAAGPIDLEVVVNVAEVQSDPEQWLLLRALAGDRGVAGDLLTLPATRLDYVAVMRGRACEALGDAAVAEQVREVLSRVAEAGAGGVALEDRFDQARAHQRALRERTDLQPRHVTGVDRGDVQRLAVESRADLLQSGEIAAWDLSREVIGVAGIAGAVTGRDVQFFTAQVGIAPSLTHWRLRSTLGSELEVVFELPAELANRPLTVTVQHLVASVNAAPGRGMARVAFVLDGRPSSKVLEVVEHAWVDHTFGIAVQDLAAGEHRLTLRALPGGGSTYWVRRVAMTATR